jgi:hypothetical protein
MGSASCELNLSVTGRGCWVEAWSKAWLGRDYMTLYLKVGKTSYNSEVCVSLDSSEGRVAGTLIGVLLGVLLLSVAAFCLIRFQKERKKEPKETYGGSDLR